MGMVISISVRCHGICSSKHSEQEKNYVKRQ